MEKSSADERLTALETRADNARAGINELHDKIARLMSRVSELEKLLYEQETNHGKRPDQPPS